MNVGMRTCGCYAWEDHPGIVLVDLCDEHISAARAALLLSDEQIEEGLKRGEAAWKLPPGWWER